MAKVTIKVETLQGTVEAVAENRQSEQTALIRAVYRLAELTGDFALESFAQRLDQIGQTEFSWPPAEHQVREVPRG